MLLDFDQLGTESFHYFQVVFHGSQLDHPYGLAYYENLLFWTEFQKGTVQCLNLENSTVTTLSTENPPLYEIRVFDNSTQTGEQFFTNRVKKVKCYNQVFKNIYFDHLHQYCVFLCYILLYLVKYMSKIIHIKSVLKKSM